MDDFRYQGMQYKSNCAKNEEPLKKLVLENGKTRVVSLKYVRSNKIHGGLEQGDTNKILFGTVTNGYERKEKLLLMKF